jgi:hypothetical protein
VAHPDYGEQHRPWSHGDLMAWGECLASKGVLRHGAKKKLSTWDVDQPVAPETLNAIFEPAALDSLMEAYEGDYRALLDWWRSRINVEYFDRAKYPADVACRRGPAALLEKPRAVVGTIHSVKGGQADVVYLFPDVSQAGAAQYGRAGPPRDSVIRLFYVGATRARESGSAIATAKRWAILRRSQRVLRPKGCCSQSALPKTAFSSSEHGASVQSATYFSARRFWRASFTLAACWRGNTPKTNCGRTSPRASGWRSPRPSRLHFPKGAVQQTWKIFQN